MEQNYNRIIVIAAISLIFILITNSYFSFQESLIYGGSDGRYYLSISDSFPKFGKDIEYIKGERFFIPYLIGFISKTFNIETYSTYRYTSLLLIFLFLIIFFKILNKINLDFHLKIISFFLIIFNPYLLRFFLAVPTLILDLTSIISSLIIVLGFLEKKKNYIYLGFLLSIISRQEGILFLFTFILSKIFFKKKSLLQTKDLFGFIILYLLIFSLNTYYAFNSSGNFKEVESLYYVTLFGIFIDDYKFIELIEFLFFPLLSIGPLIAYLVFNKVKFKKLFFNEIVFITIILTIFMILRTFLGGPYVTGKNSIRLINFSYPMILIAINIYYRTENIIFKHKKSLLIFLFLLFTLWSFHPTFSKVEIFDNIRFLFSNL